MKTNRKRRVRLTENQLVLLMHLMQEKNHVKNVELENELLEVQEEEEEESFIGRMIRGAFGKRPSGGEYYYPDAGGPTI
jgi:hypothetical protein